jgi:hypothetical protein
VTDQVSHPYNTTGRTIVLYIYVKKPKFISHFKTQFPLTIGLQPQQKALAACTTTMWCSLNTTHFPFNTIICIHKESIPTCCTVLFICRLALRHVSARLNRQFSGRLL